MGCSSTKFQLKFKYKQKSYNEGDNTTERSGKSSKRMISYRPRSSFRPEGSLDYSTDPIYLELRILLEEPLGQDYFAKFARRVNHENLLFCWVSLEQFKLIRSKDLRRLVARKVYATYIDENVSTAIDIISSEKRALLKATLADDSAPISPKMFAPLHRDCFRCMAATTYMMFRGSPESKEYQSKVSATKNKVHTDDFEYIRLLGQGSFGRVLHCRKKTTGRHYAMKVQLKTALLGVHAQDPSQLHIEKTIISTCRHPFIVGLDYAFQTKRYALLVLSLARRGDLATALQARARMQQQQQQQHRVGVGVLLGGGGAGRGLGLEG